MTEPLSHSPADKPSLRKYVFRDSTAIYLSAIEKDFSRLLFPNPAAQTFGKPVLEPLIGVAALWRGRPTGLIVCEKGSCEAARILCWSVLSEHRNRGVGTALLQRLERLVSAYGCRRLTLSFRSDWPSGNIVEELLRRNGWPEPRESLVLFKSVDRLFVEPAWFRRNLLPRGYEIFPWIDLGAQERVRIVQKQRTSTWFPAELTPFQEEDRLEIANSLGLRRRGEVVGWLITHRVDPEVIQYSSLFVSPQLQRLGRALPLVVEAIRRQRELGIPRAIFQVRADNRAAIRFVQRRMPGTVAAQVSRWIAEKELRQC